MSELDAAEGWDEFSDAKQGGNFLPLLFLSCRIPPSLHSHISIELGFAQSTFSPVVEDENIGSLSLSSLILLTSEIAAGYGRRMSRNRQTIYTRFSKLRFPSFCPRAFRLSRAFLSFVNFSPSSILAKKVVLTSQKSLGKLSDQDMVSVQQNSDAVQALIKNAVYILPLPPSPSLPSLNPFPYIRSMIALVPIFSWAWNALCLLG